ncbi:MAG: tRNA (N6-isopentenyl adenosine(37)-C2)-methylthiotransferase MiaB [Saprospiraceae bacterium]|nr:tRNA (N6-isopentenyl adenosine(37)-C2)-methylthiotransferase MiaB [Saprospiraceae bacterium]
MINFINGEGVKVVDENRQGESYYAEFTLPRSSKGLYYIESYGCSMNFSDTEIVASILNENGYSATRDVHKAELIFLNTCSIREKAEETIRRRLRQFNKIKRTKPSVQIGILGCMAERLKSRLLEEEKLVDLVAGPDAYRDLPRLIGLVSDGEKGINVYLSREETYADISPVRLDQNGVTAFISIMRGCDNMCSFCVVPFTRGRERSRDPYSIIAEAHDLHTRGYREVTLLGQNVDSYKWQHPESGEMLLFAGLLEMVAQVAPDLRVRFSTSHPKDITDEVLHTIAAYPNICKYIHLPVQSGNSRILDRMNRTYDAAWYRERVDAIRKIIPDCALSADIITGFCGETEEEHQDTLRMMEYAEYIISYMFAYSERPGTLAARKYADDVPDEVKKHRLNEIIKLQTELSYRDNLKDIGKTFEVLIEGDSKRDANAFKGRNSQNKMIVFAKKPTIKPGDYVLVLVLSVTSGTLQGEII